MTKKISQLPAGQTINNVSGTLEYKATGDITLNPGSGFINQANNAQLLQSSTASGVAVQRIKLNGDTNYRFGFSGDGILVWGSGSAAEDTYFSRTGTKKLNLRGVSSTDATLDITGNLFASSGIGIGTTSLTSPAIFQVVSTTKGSVAYPVMTTTQRDAIVAPFAGLGIYNSTNLAVEVYDGTNWEQGDGNVTGPASSTANAIARFSGTSGKAIKNTGITIDDSDVMLSTSKITLQGTLSDAIKLECITTGATYSSFYIDTTGEQIWRNPTTSTERGRIYFDGTDIRINSATKIRLLSTGDVDITPSSSVINANGNIFSAYGLNMFGAVAGTAVISLRNNIDVGRRFYIENSGNHFWCSAGDSTITHAFTIDPGIDGNFVLSDAGSTAGRLTCITEILTNQITGTSSNDLTLTTNNSAKNVIITRIPVFSSLSASVVAFAGGGQASATTLTSRYNAVTTVASAGDSVKLNTTTTMPVSSEIIVKNCTATNSMNVFPDSGSQFFYTTLQSADTSISVAPGNALTFYRRTATIWDVY